MQESNVAEVNVFYEVEGLSKYVLVKKKTLYSMVSAGSIPHYKIGRLVRFKKSEIDAWLDSLKVVPVDTPVHTGKIIRSAKSGGYDVDRIVRKSIDEICRPAYSLSNGKPGKRIKGQRKEAK